MTEFARTRFVVDAFVSTRLGNGVRHSVYPVHGVFPSALVFRPPARSSATMSDA